MTGYFTDDLPAIYASERPGSILRKATLSVAYMYTSLSPHHSYYNTLAMSEYMGTMRLINKLVRDPALAYDDVFIMALLLLGMWEVSKPIRTGRHSDY